jgi:hypothetical protein
MLRASVEPSKGQGNYSQRDAHFVQNSSERFRFNRDLSTVMATSDEVREVFA